MSDVSNVAFAVVQPLFTLTAPNTAVTWGLGTTQSIKWTHNTAATQHVDIEISRNGGGSWTPVATDVPKHDGDDWHLRVDSERADH